MMRSLYSAVSGLKSHQTRMDVIGNNISNVNTEAFKASTVTFSEILYQTTSMASGGNGQTGVGGVNAKQIGLGTSVGSTTVNVTGSGAAESTGNPFDLRLSDSQSTNFFIVSDGTNTMFTRAGSFYVDGNGFLCMSSTGYTLMGWQVDDTGEIRRDMVSALQVMAPENQTSAPEATMQAYVSGVLDKNDPNLFGEDGYVMAIGFYDSLGYAYTAKFSTKPVYDDAGEVIKGRYTVELTDIIDSENRSIMKDPTDPTGETYLVDPRSVFAAEGGGPYTLVFDNNKGTFIGIGAEDDATGTSAFLNLSQVPEFQNEMSEDGFTISNFRDIEINFSRSMNFDNGGVSTMKGLRGAINGADAGKKLGALTGLQISGDGRVYGSYDNGNTVLLCQIAAARFANASGLEKVGDNCYQTTLNSGEFDGIGVEISADGSSMTSGELEMSNVDLSGQFTDMIITQRGFQANSRIITVSDTLLEELINLKR